MVSSDVGNLNEASLKWNNWKIALLVLKLRLEKFIRLVNNLSIVKGRMLFSIKTGSMDYRPVLKNEKCPINLPYWLIEDAKLLKILMKRYGAPTEFITSIEKPKLLNSFWSTPWCLPRWCHSHYGADQSEFTMVDHSPNAIGSASSTHIRTSVLRAN